jgi:hypothetical protein
MSCTAPGQWLASTHVTCARAEAHAHARECVRCKRENAARAKAQKRVFASRLHVSLERDGRVHGQHAQERGRDAQLEAVGGKRVAARLVRAARVAANVTQQQQGACARRARTARGAP